MSTTFPCPDCDYKAKWRGHLQTHIKSVHEGVKFPCQDCDYKAKRRGDLQTHIKSVHKGERFPCSDCEYTATQNGNLQRHIKSVHNERRPPDTHKISTQRSSNCHLVWLLENKYAPQSTEWERKVTCSATLYLAPAWLPRYTLVSVWPSVSPAVSCDEDNDT